MMTSIFWDSQGFIIVDYLEDGRTINGAFYAEEHRKEGERWLEMFSLFQDNTSAHTSQVAMLLRLKAASRSFLIPRILNI